MKKPSEIFDTPEATGFSRVGGNEEIINELTEDWYKFPPELRHSNDSILRIVLAKALTTKDQEKEEAIRLERERFVELLDRYELITTEEESYPTGHVSKKHILKALHTEDNN